MKSFVAHKLLSAATAIGITLMIPGCLLGPKEAGNTGLSSAQFASDEVANMGNDAGNIMGGVGLGKETAMQPETTYINWTLHPYTWDSVGQCYIRSATFSTMHGYDRSRIDTITFTDINNVKIQHPTRLTVAAIHHVRHVTHSRNGEEANVRFDMTAILKNSTDTTLVKNGTMTGTYNNEEFASGTVTNVTRHLVNNKWQFPESGSVTAAFPNHTYSIEYLGNGSAQATLTNLKTDKVTVVNIQVDQR